MPDSCTIRVNGSPLQVPLGTSVLAAVLLSGQEWTRVSITGEARGPLCGMGVCFECRLTINGVKQQRSCLLPCSEGLEIET